MELQVALVGLADREGERVVAGVLARRAGEVARPGLAVGGPEGVRGRSDLHDHGVQAARDGLVVPPHELVLLLLDAETRAGRPVDVDHAGDPLTAQLSLRCVGGDRTVAGGAVRCRPRCRCGRRTGAVAGRGSSGPGEPHGQGEQRAGGRHQQGGAGSGAADPRDDRVEGARRTVHERLPRKE